jgi:hypothetical protein
MADPMRAGTGRVHVFTCHELLSRQKKKMKKSNILRFIHLH